MSHSNREPRPVTGKRVLGRVTALLVIWALLLFLPAGTLAWPQAWALILAYGLFLTSYARYGLARDPEQLSERSSVAENVKPWDRTIIRVYGVLMIALFVLAGLDAGRFRWSRVAPAWQAAGWLGLLLAGIWITWALRSNTFLSRYARIQDDRAQAVVSGGPYRYTRHPMYSGIIVLFLSVGPALASAWALLPGLLIAALFVVRTTREDRMLREELNGYEDYAARVRWRLFPGLW